MLAKFHARHPHPNSHSNFNLHLHARQAQPDQSISISDPLPIPTLSGLDPTGAVESATATGSRLVLPSGVPVSEDAQSVVTVMTTTTRTTSSSEVASRTLSGKGSASSSSSDSFASVGSRNNEDNLSIPAVIGICIGVFVGLALLILFVVWWSKRKRHDAHKSHFGKGRGTIGGDGGSFEQIVSGEDAARKGLEGGVGVGVGRMEKPPPYENFASHPSTGESSSRELMVPIHLDTNTSTELPPLSPSSPTIIALRSRSTSPLASPTPPSLTHIPQNQFNQRTSVSLSQHGYTSSSSLLSAHMLSPSSGYSSSSTATTPHSATAFVNSTDGTGVHERSKFGEAQALYLESRALLEGRRQTEPTTPTSSSHTVQIPANNSEEHMLASELSHTKLGFDTSLGMSHTFHDRSSTPDLDASSSRFSLPSDDEHSHSYLTMRNSDSDLSLQNLQMSRNVNVKTSSGPEAKSPAVQFGFEQRQEDYGAQSQSWSMEREGEVVTRTLSIYSSPSSSSLSSPSPSRPSFGKAHKRTDTDDTITNINKNSFSDARMQTLAKLDIDSLPPVHSVGQKFSPGHKKMASLLAALDIPVTPSSETGGDIYTDTDADAETKTETETETETETDVDTEVFPMPPASVVSAIR